MQKRMPDEVEELAGPRDFRRVPGWLESHAVVPPLASAQEWGWGPAGELVGPMDFRRLSRVARPPVTPPEMPRRAEGLAGGWSPRDSAIGRPGPRAAAARPGGTPGATSPLGRIAPA
ncbi:hypothetical protein GCM10017566_14420 [Amycolatopsis bartoniae]|uniref:Uncharacterized protein n=1 Tax=Amycolatopsis bartoniae TaxID=941986 RepID=A0A8H9IWI8_9PSEU|nr:hypothetical protein GCM10017566_14420 [Amycolatopsis bartoniae]